MFDRFLELFTEPTSLGPITTPNLSGIPEGAIPDALFQLWTELRLGSYMDGYVKIVSPDTYRFALEEVYEPIDGTPVIFAATAMADLFFWEADCIRQANFRYGTLRVASTSLTTFVNHRMSKWENVATSLGAAHFRPALERLGPCAYDECYAYVPALAFGGSEKVENLHKVKLREHLAILSQMVGRIG